jgi:hypothetical protein
MNAPGRTLTVAAWVKWLRDPGTGRERPVPLVRQHSLLERSGRQAVMCNGLPVIAWMWAFFRTRRSSSARNGF